MGGSGYWQEPELGLAYVRARWLNEGTGSWLSVDPVSSEPRYSYAHNMPTTHVDPSGRQSGLPPSPMDQFSPGAMLQREWRYDVQQVPTDFVNALAHVVQVGIDFLQPAQDYWKTLQDKDEASWKGLVEAAAEI